MPQRIEFNNDQECYHVFFVSLYSEREEGELAMDHKFILISTSILQKEKRYIHIKYPTSLYLGYQLMIPKKTFETQKLAVNV